MSYISSCNASKVLVYSLDIGIKSDLEEIFKVLIDREYLNTIEIEIKEKGEDIRSFVTDSSISHIFAYNSKSVEIDYKSLQGDGIDRFLWVYDPELKSCDERIFISNGDYMKNLLSTECIKTSIDACI